MKKLSLACGLLLASGALYGQQYQIGTFAGNGTPGWSGDYGPATSAQLFNPIRVAIDPSGNLYITDYGNSSIRKVLPDGTMTSVAGNGSAGFSGDGGFGIGAQLSSPHQIALDSAGNLYIADTANGRIRRIDTSGNISTFAGTGVHGYSGDGGAAVDANLMLPTGVAVDRQGNVYVADAGNASVRKVTPAGIISTFAGSGFISYGGFQGEGGPARQALLGTPYSMATDAVGNVYISDIGLGRLFRVTTDGTIRTVAANFLSQDVAVDGAGNIYFADYQNNTVQKILPAGTILWIGGDGSPGYTGDGGIATSAQMQAPYGVAVDAAGNVYVAEATSAVVRKLTPVHNSIGAIANAASIRAFARPAASVVDATIPIAPGEVVVLFGTGLGPSTLVSNTPGANGFYGTQLAGTTVTFAGIPAPILYASSTLVSAIVPYGVDGLSSADVVVTYQGQSAVDYVAPVAATSPGIFTADTTGSGQALGWNFPDGSLNDATHPVAQGGYVIVYATGEGATSPAGIDGKPAPITAPFPMPNQTVTATVNGATALVSYAGGAPGFVAGLMQVNVQIPADTAPGPAALQLSVGGVNSQITTISIGQ